MSLPTAEYIANRESEFYTWRSRWIFWATVTCAKCGFEVTVYPWDRPSVAANHMVNHQLVAGCVR